MSHGMLTVLIAWDIFAPIAIGYVIYLEHQWKDKP